MGPALLLVLNAGSSSLKAALFAMAPTGDGSPSPEAQELWRQQRPWTPPDDPTDASGLQQAIETTLGPWLATELEPWMPHIQLVAHRVVHGGEQVAEAAVIDAGVRAGIAAARELAPLHNTIALAVIDWLESWLEGRRQTNRPRIVSWACFDTAFHRTLPPEQSTYALPQAWRDRGLRRYGFHGLNHRHVSETVQAIYREEGSTDAQLAQLRLISGHLGAGCSLCAIAGGRSMATTMGYTPLEGLVMANRSGSVDPGLLLQLLRQGQSAAELDNALNHRSGLLGLSGLSGDMRVLRQAAAEEHPGALLAIAVFTARLLQGIGAMAASLGGVDVIALSGGIGQNDAVLAHTLHDALSWLGPFRLLQIPADEERQIAQQCLAAARQRP
ncbi:MAG: acetate kinase [Cyanobacteriota bacterium]|nr:acetate kinase [Cyanobacteriota bacterium]